MGIAGNYDYSVLPLPRAQVQFLAGELKFHKLNSAAERKQQQQQSKRPECLESRKRVVRNEVKEVKRTGSQKTLQSIERH